MNSLGVLLLFALIVAACGAEGGQGDTYEPDDPVLQITSEGGFAPVEVILNNGPRYTLLGDGTLIFQGVTTLEFPGQLVPPYLTAQLNENQFDAVLAMVEDMGLADIDEEIDDRANQFVADATTEVITYWDDTGEHRYGVYALGLDEASSERNEVFLELIETVDRFTAEAASEVYEPVQVRVLANVRAEPREVDDLRPWPLGPENFEEWATLPNGWGCKVFDADILPSFEDATQVTEWEHPDHESQSVPPVQLLVRPLLPGEPDCPQ